jgi:hypothetical protein
MGPVPGSLKTTFPRSVSSQTFKEEIIAKIECLLIGDCYWKKLDLVIA